MKIRFGFVSNSSSSCFIVGFERDPSLKEVVRVFHKLIAFAHRKKLVICKFLPDADKIDEFAKYFFREMLELPRYSSDPEKQSSWAKKVLELIEVVNKKQKYLRYLKLSILNKETQDLADFLIGLDNLDFHYVFLRYIGVT